MTSLVSSTCLYFWNSSFRLRQIKETTRDMPLQINCSKAELLAGLKAGTLDRNVMYWVDSGIDSVEEANRIMEMVRCY